MTNPLARFYTEQDRIEALALDLLEDPAWTGTRPDENWAKAFQEARTIALNKNLRSNKP